MLKLKLCNLLPLSLVVLTACEMSPRYMRPKTVMPKFDTKVDVSKFLQEKWWSIFNNDILNQLEERALKNNANLRQAIENIKIAEAQADIAFSNFSPSIGAVAGGTSTRISSTGNDYRAGMPTRTANSYSAGLQASYEIDLFGKYQSASNEAKAILLSTKAAKQVVLLSVTSHVAKTYFLIRALESKLQIAQRTLKSRQETYDVYDQRFKNGYCTQLNFLRVKSELYSVKSTVLNLEKALSIAETSLSVLIGCNPREMYGWKLPEIKAVDRLKSDVAIPAGVPSDILARRPDVVAAEGQLMAANAKVGAAMSAHFPTFSLTGFLGFESKKLTTVFNPVSEMLNFGGNIALPLFTGGKIEASRDMAKAGYRKQLIAYKQAVRVAFKETLDALMSYHQDTEIVASRKNQVDALRRSYYIAKQQKDVGAIGLIDLLDVERGLLATEIELVEAQYSKMSSIIDVCKAFGGGWNELKLMEN